MEFHVKIKRARAEVDLDAIAHNFYTVRSLMAPTAKLCCVVKANAYGHGAVTLGHYYEKWGADFLAVSNMEEALELRRANIALPVLVLGYTPPEYAKALAVYDISQCVFSYDYAKALSDAALACGVSVKAHFKVDSGMGRIGFDFRKEAAFEASLLELKNSACLPSLIREGIFTHFSSADEGEGGRAFTLRQFSFFQKVTEALAKEGIVFSLRHAANSAAILDYPETCLDMVRAGIVLYGLPPSDALQTKADLRPALALKTVVDLIKNVEAGEPIGYGRAFCAEKAMRIATLPIGYADGLWRAAGDCGLSFTVNGERVPVVGRICMDQCMIDVTHLQNIKEGDTVTVFGGEGESVQRLASRLGTIGYELLCAVGERIPRAYISDGKIVSVSDRILP